ncbi:trypsin-like serine peptidase [Amycolatopsis anabasis]|uniref:trypsin-like serine peptidase n=1 Tax=Amycolatopsis anabasis TaxID=1840409 RepID=UPI00131C7CD7|nr:serine protease [Amycolatopsis anabasis]
MPKSLQLLAALALLAPMAVGAQSAEPADSAPVASHEQTAQRVGADETITSTLGHDSPSTTIDRPGAWYVKVHVTGLHLQPGDVLTVASPDGSETHTYSADVTGNPAASPDATGFWALSITGQTAVVSLRGPDGAAAPASRATVDRITRGFTPQEFAATTPIQPYSICGRNDYKDAVCYQSSNPTEFGKTPPVARLLMNGGSLCTGWRVGASNRVLTNNHCIGNASTAANTEVWFNYQCTTCGGSTNAPVTKVLGSTLLKTNAALDYTLFDVKDFGKISSFGYLELDTTLPAVGDEMYIIGHPSAKPKKVSLADDQSTGGICKVTAVKVQGDSAQSDIAYKCDTEGGSSGSPVLSRKTQKVIGLHHWGGCPNQGVRIDLIAAQIGSLL